MIKMAFFRTLLSQSAASLTMNSIGAVLQHAGIDVDLTLLEKGRHTNSKVLTQEHLKYPILLLKLNFQDYEEGLALALESKAQGLFSKLIVCGPFATLNADRLVTLYPDIDGVIQGYGEETMLELALHIRDCRNWPTHISGGIWRDTVTGRHVRGGIRINRLSLDELPLPLREIEQKERAGIANLEGSRGCIANCSFCHLPALKPFGSEWNIKSIKRIVDEMEILYKDYNKRYLIFNDSVFWSGPKDDARMLEFADALESRNLDIWFMIYLRCNPFPSETIIKRLASVGLVRVFLGVESATEGTLKLYRKGVHANTFENVRDVLARHGVSWHIGFMVFHPLVSIEEVKTNIEYLYAIDKLFRVGVIVEKMRIVPGTGMDRNAKNLIKENGRSVDQAYSYTFLNDEVGELHAGFRQMFFGNLESLHASAEFFCTSTNLALTIAQRFQPGFLTKHQAQYETFVSNKNYYQRILLEYFSVCINGVQINKWTRSEVSSPSRHEAFISEFKRTYRKLQISWAGLIEVVRSDCRPDIVESLFTGEESV